MKLKYDSQIIDEELRLAMKRKVGLTIIPAPTGSGKSYNLELNMCRYGKKHLEDPDSCTFRRMVILYPNKVNIPKEEDLAKRIKQIISFRTDEQAKTWIKNNVMYCKNNLECLSDGVKKNPDLLDDLKLMKNLGKYGEDLKSILGNIKQYVNFMKDTKGNEKLGKFIKDNIEKGAKDSEGKFRKTMRSYMRLLRSKIKTAKKQKDKKALEELKEEKLRAEKWIKKVYNLADYENHSVLIMTVDKFFSPYDPILGKVFLPREKDFVKGSLIVIDESDSAYIQIRNSYIDKLNKYPYSFVEFLARITSQYLHWVPSTNIDAIMKRAFKRVGSLYRLNNMVIEGECFAIKYHLNGIYKTDEKSLAETQGMMPALLNDGIQVNLGDNKRFVSMYWDEQKNRVSLSIGKNSAELAKKSNMNILDFFISGERLIRKFCIFLTRTAEEYAKELEEKKKRLTPYRNAYDANLELEETNPLGHIMNAMGIAKQDKEVLWALCDYRNLKARVRSHLTNSYFASGYSVRVIEDDPEQHPLNSIIRVFTAYETPEYVLTYLAKQTNVICLSATGLNKSVNENFAIDYLKEELGDNFHVMTDRAVKELREFYAYRNQAYFNHQWRIHVIPLQENASESVDGKSNVEMTAAAIFKNKEIFVNLCGCIYKSLQKVREEDEPKRWKYDYGRYCNLIIAMYHFISNPNHYSMVCLEKAGLTTENKHYKLEVVEEIKSAICNDLQIDPKSIGIKASLSAGFDKATEDVIKAWGNGEKVIFFSSYATTAKGSNLCYPLPNIPSIKAQTITLAPELKKVMPQKYAQKDIDCLYLGNYSYLTETVNGSQSKKDRVVNMHKIINEAEKLYEANQIGHRTKMERIEDAYRCVINPTYHHRTSGSNIKGCEGICNATNKNIKQSIGRIDRVNIKNKDTVIFIAEENLKNIDRMELEDTKLDLVPAMLEIKKTLDGMHGEVSEEDKKKYLEDKVLMKGGTQQLKSCRYFKNLFYAIRKNDEDSEKYKVVYNHLREFVLRYPTVTEEEYAAMSDEDKWFVRHFFIDTVRSDTISYDYMVEDGMYRSDKDLDDQIINLKGFNLSGKDKVQESHTSLSVALKVAGVADIFAKKGYATHWKPGRYIITPKGLDVYRGILGETVASVILTQILDKLNTHLLPEEQYHLEDMDTAVFEKFDYKVKNLLIDVKDWRYGVDKARIDEKRFIKHNQDKRVECNTHYGINGTVIILNLCPKDPAMVNRELCEENNYVEIPRLLYEDGSLDEKAVNALVELITRGNEK